MTLKTPPFTTKREKLAYLKKHGWGTWYHPDYWVNPKVIADPKSQDYTNYGMSLDDAVTWQWNRLGKVKQRFGIPSLNVANHLGDRNGK